MRDTLVVLLMSICPTVAAGSEVCGGQPLIATRTYEYEVSPRKRATLERGLLLLKVGDSVAHTKKILGQPDKDFTISRPRLIGRFEFRARVLSYHLKLVKVGGGNIYDERIDVSFDVHDKLVKIVRAPTPMPSQGRKVSTPNPARPAGDLPM